ncbi:MFS transporter-like protein [Pseudovirgaria hyperparasitica]|uniref:MFS transporter-like protein n=1 Tax=Pseudovirgaria hyperparasitica TaxID=470096 RepID=A0A6A6VS24_9PEZI|nr:MFS transporter-like protein [Pseudovirgaria hyperparasitica]KAF2753488.1 MFS transporter-like protein [Pseudovirgaria hyperparasitica]
MKPPTGPRRKASTPHYHTFPTKPPTSRGPPPPSQSTSGDDASGADSEHGDGHHETPLPKKQLAMLAVIALAEQTAFNSISPYLPDMASTFPEVKDGQVGLYVGLIASSFALAQFATNFFWGWLSDKIGRKPVILLGTFLTAACFIAFGFCRTLWQAIIVQVFMGLVNGNQGVVSTCLGEITDRSNQSRAFTYLPVVYGLGAITGPLVGGLLVFKKDPFHPSQPNPYPYLFPNIFATAVLLVDLILAMFFLEESLDEARELPPLGKRIENLFSWLWQFTSSSRPSYMRRSMGKRRTSRVDGNDDRGSIDEEEDDSDSTPIFTTSNDTQLTRSEVLNRDTILIMCTYFIFQLSNIAYNSLYPVFAQAEPPAGRNLSPEEIGLSLSFAGIITIVFQVGIYGQLREKIGNKTTYRISLVTFAVAFLLMPWVGYKDGDNGTGLGSGKVWLWIELGFVLIVKTVATVGGLTSALLLITNSAPNHSVLGTLNGLAQTLSAAGRAAGPFISGALFTASTKIEPKGEALAFGLFGGVAFLGFLLSFGIRGVDLEAEGWGDDSTEDEDEEFEIESPAEESAGLLR